METEYDHYEFHGWYRCHSTNRYKTLSIGSDLKLRRCIAQILHESPIEYKITSTEFGEEDPVGLFGPTDVEGSKCASRMPVRMNNKLRDISEAELLFTRGHELGHAALYDHFFLGRPGIPDFVGLGGASPDEPGGCGGEVHTWWTYEARTLFRE